ncbi:MAG: AAA family ATPase [Lachnospiraceae bacterium]|nr:AAA family ATPase [Lachnospiraceae bacterium]
MNEQDKIQKKIFEEEQAHLTQTHGRLRVMESELEEKIKSISEKAAQEKKDIRSNLSLNFDSDTDSMETYIEFEAMSHSIDQYNIEQDAAKEKLGRVKRLLKAPYFARVTLQFDPEEEPENYYIGSAGVSENAFEHLVIDWRSPIAETYYNQDNGRTFYMVEGRRVDVDLQLRRQYNLEEDRLYSFFDTQVAIEDPLLLQSLASHRTDKMKAITATIQKEQNAVIRCSDVPVLLVNGIAGSGKTSVLLQRIAYLFYRKRENLRPEQVYLLTINPVFRQYIDQVLPDLGEENPRTITWRDFVHIAKAPDKGPFEPAKESDLRKIENTLKSLRLEEGDFRPIMQKGRCILSRKEIAKVADSLSEIEPGARFSHILADRLSEIARVKIRRIERDENEKRSAGEQAESAGSAAFNSMDPYAETDEPGMREQNRIKNEFGGAFSAIEHFSFLDIERIGGRLTKRKKLSSAEWIWLKILLTGMGDKNVKYVMIDEVQDYTAAQLMVLRRYFDRAKFMMLGDEFQAIRPGTVSFEKIRELFGEEGREAVELPLLTSYRSSPEITEIFTGLLPREKRINTASVQRPGTAPVKMGCADSDDYLRRLKALINAAEEEEGLTAIICGNRGSLEKIRELLGDKAPQVISRNQALPGKGTFLITLDLVKGLEFDGVILPDADAKMYPDDLLARHRLYTAVSRATRRLSILADGELTGLLQS